MSYVVAALLIPVLVPGVSGDPRFFVMFLYSVIGVYCLYSRCGLWKLVSNVRIGLDQTVSFFCPSSSSLRLICFRTVTGTVSTNTGGVRVDVTISSCSGPRSLAVMVSSGNINFAGSQCHGFAGLLRARRRSRGKLKQLIFLGCFGRICVRDVFRGRVQGFAFGGGFRGGGFALSPTPSTACANDELTFDKCLGGGLCSCSFLGPMSVERSVLCRFCPRLFSVIGTNGSLGVSLALSAGRPGPRRKFCGSYRVLVTDRDISLRDEGFPTRDLSLFSAVSVFCGVGRAGGRSSLMATVYISKEAVPVSVVSGRSAPGKCRVIFLLCSDFFANGAGPSQRTLALSRRRLGAMGGLFEGRTAVVLGRGVPDVRRRGGRVARDLGGGCPRLTNCFSRRSVKVVSHGGTVRATRHGFFRTRGRILSTPGAVSARRCRGTLGISSQALVRCVLCQGMVVGGLGRVSGGGPRTSVRSVVIPEGGIYKGTKFVGSLCAGGT